MAGSVGDSHAPAYGLLPDGGQDSLEQVSSESSSCAFISELFCDIASVADGAKRCKRSDNCAIFVVSVILLLQN